MNIRVTSVGATRGVNEIGTTEADLLLRVRAQTFHPLLAASLSSGGFSNVFPAPSYQAADTAAYVAQLGSTYQGLYNPSGRGFPGQPIRLLFSAESYMIYPQLATRCLGVRVEFHDPGPSSRLANGLGYIGVDACFRFHHLLDQRQAHGGGKEPAWIFEPVPVLCGGKSSAERHHPRK